MMTSDQHAANLCQAIAEEIRRIGASIDELAAVLVADDDIALRHIDRLQAFDMIVQRAGESAHLLEQLASGIRSHEAVEAVKLESVQLRLRAALKGS